MSTNELFQLYFERSNALTWYWTVYILVVGGVIGFSAFRQRPEIITTVLVIVLYVCFAYKNLGAIEETTQQRAAVLVVIQDQPPSGTETGSAKRLRDAVLPTLAPTSLDGVRYFHIACDLMTIVVLVAKELRRRQLEQATGTAAR
jgi:hypothetical protein